MKNQKTDKLSKYLTATVGASALASSAADAGIIAVDISSFTGPNGGLSSGSSGSIPLASGSLTIRNNAYASFGNALGFEVSGSGAGIASGTTYTTPLQISLGTTIDAATVNGGTTVFTGNPDNSAFRLFYNGGYTSPDFGSDTFLAFRDGLGNFGWIEATWDGSTFELLGIAYEDSGAPIEAGAIPEASNFALIAAGAAGLAALRRRRKASK
ncbi:MAG: hypothetical protein AAGH40_04015 [Verrucomicrobiota bacterium]